MLVSEAILQVLGSCYFPSVLILDLQRMVSQKPDKFGHISV